MSVRGWVARGPVLLRRTPAALATEALVAGQELAWLTAHALTYPAGLLAEQAALDDPATASTPCPRSPAA